MAEGPAKPDEDEVVLDSPVWALAPIRGLIYLAGLCVGAARRGREVVASG